MKRANKQGFLVRYQYPQKLVKWRDTFAKRKPLKPADDPLEPFMSVTDDVLTVRDARHGLRIAYLLPLVIGLWFISLTFVADLGPNSGEVSFAKDIVELEHKDRYDLNYKYYEALLGVNGNASFFNYLDAVVNYSTENHQDAVYFDIIIALVSSIFALLSTAFFINSPRPADIYFDRKRGIVYTWFFGRLAACRFDNLGFLERKTGLLLYLYGENKKRKGGYDVVPITLQPTGKVHLNSELDNDYFFEQIFNFMDKGKSAVITGESFHRPQPNTYFFTDKKPQPFEERLDKILEREDVLPDLYEHLKVAN